MLAQPTLWHHVPVPTLTEAFRRAWSGPPPELPHDFEDQLAVVCALGREEVTPSAPTPERLAAYVAERLTAAGAGPTELGRLQIADLGLACACADGDAAALARFEKRFLEPATVRACLRHIDATPALVDEVRQLLRVRLLLGEPPVPPRITQYSGIGALSSWVGIAAQRTALNLLRGEQTRARVNREVVAEALPMAGDPELDYLKARYRGEFREAIGAALATLAVRKRLVLRLHLVDQLSHERIAGMYQVHQTTVSRWIGGAREVILRETRRALQARLNLDSAELQSLQVLVGNSLDLSLTRLLRE
jgi:RNA polymerase sigma-70 factor (ECF subfamily)